MMHPPLSLHLIPHLHTQLVHSRGIDGIVKIFVVIGGYLCTISPLSQSHKGCDLKCM